MPQLFDIVYAQSDIAPPFNGYVMWRKVEALDRTHALLWWLRRTTGLSVDPVEMFGDGYEHTANCGCDYYVSFDMQRLSWLTRVRSGEQAVPTARISVEPCEKHRDQLTSDDPRTHRDWDGVFAAWIHDPKRATTFKWDQT